MMETRSNEPLPQTVKLFMNIKERNALLIESVELTDEEIRESILEGKRKKYFHNKHKNYWSCIAPAETDQKTKTPASVQAAEESDAKQSQ